MRRAKSCLFIIMWILHTANCFNGWNPTSYKRKHTINFIPSSVLHLSTITNLKGNFPFASLCHVLLWQVSPIRSRITLGQNCHKKPKYVLTDSRAHYITIFMLWFFRENCLRLYFGHYQPRTQVLPSRTMKGRLLEYRQGGLCEINTWSVDMTWISVLSIRRPMYFTLRKFPNKNWL